MGESAWSQAEQDHIKPQVQQACEPIAFFGSRFEFIGTPSSIRELNCQSF
jgi:hypothetical protein